VLPETPEVIDPAFVDTDHVVEYLVAAQVADMTRAHC
jgi:hypothetical protein